MQTVIQRSAWRLVLVLLGGLLLPTAVAAEEDLSVLGSEVDGVPVRRLLTQALHREAQRHFDQRRQQVEAISTPEQLRHRQDELREKFLDALGGFPDRTPLNAQIVGRSDGDGFRLERVIYESRPEHHVTANLFLPTGPPPFPAVLIPCGHSSNGKAGYQRLGILLARHGLAALCYDPIGQGERWQLLDEAGKPLARNSTTEHTLVGVSSLLVGESTATYRIWDGIRSLDYLVSRPDIDPRRIGCTGSSGGGTLTSYLMALDQRIAAAAPSCYITSLERLFATIGPQDAEQNITGQVAFGMNHADYLTMRAPRPVLICASTQDFFDIEGTWTTFREAKRLYGVLGHPERVSLVESNTRHGFPKLQREQMLRWMRRWLMEIDDAPEEGEFALVPESELRCTRTGQVLMDLKGRSVVDLIAAREAELARDRTAWQAGHSADEFRAEVRRLLALPETVPAAVVKEGQETIRRDGYTIHKRTFQTEPGIAVPGLLFVPDKDDQAHGPRPVGLPVIYLHGRGKAVDAAPGGPIETLVKAGRRVLAIDVRGVGETAAGLQPTGRPGHFGVDFKNAFLAFHLNRPLLGLRVYDLLAVAGSLAEESEIELIGVGSAGPVALHAAALEPRIRGLTLDGALTSWKSVVRSPLHYDQLTNVVPGALRRYDLPELAALVAPRPLTVRAAVDPHWEPVSPDTLNEEYTATTAAYAQHQATPKLVLRAGVESD